MSSQSVRFEFDAQDVVDPFTHLVPVAVLESAESCRKMLGAVVCVCILVPITLHFFARAPPTHPLRPVRV